MSSQRMIAGAAWLSWPQVRKLQQAFTAAGQELRFVGGCVRDTLLGREVGELDAATPALPEAVMALLQDAGIAALPTGIKHGTVTALVDHFPIEITTLRRDIDCDGRHAEVVYTDAWEEDAKRRDFTINAIYADGAGRLYDYVGGFSHLEPLALVFIGDPAQRIREDALRMLRYFRFLAQLRIAPAGADIVPVLRAHAGLIERLSGERIAQEMRKLLASLEEVTPLQMMGQADLLPALLLPSPPLWMPSLLELERVHRAPPRARFIRRLAAWLLDGPPENAQALIRRWKLSNAEAEALQFRLRDVPLIGPGMPAAERKKLMRRIGRERFIESLFLAWARSGADHAGLLKWAAGWEIPEFPLGGKDMLTLGIPPGKAVGEMLAALEEEWEAADYSPTRAQLLQKGKERWNRR